MNLTDIRSLASRPGVVVASVVLGVVAGMAIPAVALKLTLVSQIYLALLKMIVLPFMVSAIIFSLYRLFLEGQTGRLLARMTVLFLLVLLVSAVMAAAASLLVAPGKDLPAETMVQLGRMVGGGTGLGASDEMALLSSEEVAVEHSVADMLRQLIPDNIFSALAQGETLKAFVFALLFGCALSRVPSTIADSLSSSMETIFHVCQTLTRWFNYFLPLVLFCMVASQIAQSGLEPLQAMLGFLVTLILVSCVLVLGAFWVLVRTSGQSWRQVLVSQREPMTMALATRSSQACMPAMIESLVVRLGFPHYRVELLIPLGVSLLRVGPVLYYVVATFFIAHLYDRVLSVQDIIIVVLASMLAGLASTGMSGLLVLSMIGLVCGFLSLPFEAALALFVAVEPVSDVFRTLVSVAVNNAWAAAVCGAPEDRAQPADDEGAHQGGARDAAGASC
jgi:Na+/H+-dicarboxylate symporter